MKAARIPSLFRAWMEGDPSPAYLLAGEGAGLSEMLAEFWLIRFREAGETSELVHWTVQDLERESPAAWRTPSFFVRRRVFLLPDAGEWKQGQRKEILSYLATPDPSVLLVIPCADRREMRPFSPVKEVRASNPREEDVVSALADFAVSAVSDAGKELSGDAALFLARWVGADYPRIKAEIGKLLSFAGSRREIGEEEIREVCIAGGSVDPFRLAEDLIAGNRERCLEKVRRFAEGAEPGEYHALVGAIAWSVRRKLSAPARGDGGRAPRFPARGAAFRPGRGAKILSALSSLDRGLKGGSALTPEQQFEILLLKLLA